jgi:hypothetical protein
LQLWRNNNTHKYSSEHRRLSLLQSSLRTYRGGSAAAAQSMCKEKCAGDALQTEPVQNARARPLTLQNQQTRAEMETTLIGWCLLLFLKLAP